jgi:hypothetical protein
MAGTHDFVLIVLSSLAPLMWVVHVTGGAGAVHLASPQACGNAQKAKHDSTPPHG